MSKSRKRRSYDLAEKLMKLGFTWDPEFITERPLEPGQLRARTKRILVEEHIREGVKWMTRFHSGGIYCWRFVVPGIRLSDLIATGMYRGHYEKASEDSVMFKCSTRHEVHLVLDYLEQLRIIAKS